MKKRRNRMNHSNYPFFTASGKTGEDETGADTGYRVYAAAENDPICADQPQARAEICGRKLVELHHDRIAGRKGLLEHWIRNNSPRQPEGAQKTRWSIDSHYMGDVELRSYRRANSRYCQSEVK